MTTSAASARAASEPRAAKRTDEAKSATCDASRAHLQKYLQVGALQGFAA